ncbi:MAG TPA: regulatory protein RecX [Vicinamibacterales bacterium]
MSDVADAYVAGLRMLARRELSEAQLRVRLERRQFEPDDIEPAIARLRGEGALDDRRTALACARTEAHVKRHGRLRVLRQLEALGIARGLAKAAVAEVFADIDEDSLLAQTLERRLRQAASLDQAAVRRVQRYLLAQGFEAARVTAALRSRVRNVEHED